MAQISFNPGVTASESQKEQLGHILDDLGFGPVTVCIWVASLNTDSLIILENGTRNTWSVVYDGLFTGETTFVDIAQLGVIEEIE